MCKGKERARSNLSVFATLGHLIDKLSDSYAFVRHLLKRFLHIRLCPRFICKKLLSLVVVIIFVLIIIKTATFIKTKDIKTVILFYGKEEVDMDNTMIVRIEMVIEFIENHLDDKLDLDAVATAVHYSKYHLHRIFTEAVGITIHDYVGRRKLTEAAKLLVFSERPIIEIAFICGYESQQAFTVRFKAMYKVPPAIYREQKTFYPLQLRFSLHKKVSGMAFLKSDIRLAAIDDIPEWIKLVHLVIDGYPYLDETDYIQKLTDSIQGKRALILKNEDSAVGAMVFSYDTGSIEFMGVHPQYRSRGIQKIFLDKLMEEYLPGREISTTTYREHDKADTGYRKELKQLGFAERELLIEFGYPTQRFVLPPHK